MATQPVPNVAQCSLKYDIEEQKCQNDLYFYKSSGWTLSDLQNLSDAAITNWATFIAPRVTNVCQLREVISTDLTSLDGARDSSDVNPIIVGTRPGGSLPNNVSFAVKLGIGKRGRGRQGRIFHPNLSEGDVVVNQIDLTETNSILTAWQSFAGALETASTSVHCVVHRYLNGVKLPAATNDPVTSYTATDRIVDSQKLRLPNHKRTRRKVVGP